MSKVIFKVNRVVEIVFNNGLLIKEKPDQWAGFQTSVIHGPNNNPEVIPITGRYLD